MTETNGAATLEIIDLHAEVDGKEILRITDHASPLSDGGFAFICEEGLITSDEIIIKPKKGAKPPIA